MFFFAGIVLTNDGNAILREIDVSQPAAKVRLLKTWSAAMYHS
jgi:chaperonin GroEL (HSP60 family)